MDRDLALKFAEDKTIEVEQLYMALGETHSFSKTTCDQICVDNFACEILEQPYVQDKHANFSNLQVLEGSIDL